MSRSYVNASRALDEHVDTCPDCQHGPGCPDGDDTAEAEFWAFRSLQRDDPDAARAAQRQRR